MRAFSVAGRRWNASLAGVFWNRCSTSILVPFAIPNGSIEPLMPSSITIRLPSVFEGRLAMPRAETMPMLASASPRNPRVWMELRSSRFFNLEVAWRSSAKGRSSASIPLPSSSIRMRSKPPRSTVITIRFASASRLFSSNSLTTCAGRSTTSPAAIWPMVASSSWTILFGSLNCIASKEFLELVKRIMRLPWRHFVDVQPLDAFDDVVMGLWH